MFIVVEWIDGSGKTTFCKNGLHKIPEMINIGGNYIITAEPTTGTYGKQAREILKNHSDLSRLPELFALDRREHIKEIQAYLDKGITVICDRYVLSNLAYQSLDFPMDRIAELNRDILIPDITVFLDTDPETAMQRITARGEKREVFEKLELMRKVRDNYYTAMKDFKEFCPNTVILV